MYAFKFAVIARRDSGASIGAPNGAAALQHIIPAWGDAALSACAVSFDVAASGIRIKVQGLTNSTIRWTWNKITFLSTDS